MKYGGHDFSGLLKIAGFTTGLSFPSAYKNPTVGDAFNAMNANLNMNPWARRSVFDQVNRAGIDVKEPASRISNVLGGALTGYFGANMLGANRFWRNTAAVGGALIGNSMFNNAHPDPNKHGAFTFHNY